MNYKDVYDFIFNNENSRNKSYKIIINNPVNIQINRKRKKIFNR